MSFLDGLLGQVSDNATVQNLASKVGLSPDEIENAVSALGQAHQSDGDTVETAAENTGLPTAKLQEIVEHLGGEGSLGKIAGMLEGGSGAGGLLGGLTGMFGGNANEE